MMAFAASRCDMLFSILLNEYLHVEVAGRLSRIEHRVLLSPDLGDKLRVWA
jgi:hypothetical protein